MGWTLFLDLLFFFFDNDIFMQDAFALISLKSFMNLFQLNNLKENDFGVSSVLFNSKPQSWIGDKAVKLESSLTRSLKHEALYCIYPSIFIRQPSVDIDSPINWTIVSDPAQYILILMNLKWYESPIKRMMIRTMMAETAKMFRKFPTTISISCCCLDIFLDWNFLKPLKVYCC